MASKSGTRGSDATDEDFASAMERLRRDAAPVLAKAFDLDRAEAAEAALNAMAEIIMAGRELVRALPLPPESRRHLDNAEREAVRAAKLAVASIDKEAKKRRSSGKLQQVQVAFGAQPAAPPGKKTKRAKPAGGARRKGRKA